MDQRAVDELPLRAVGLAAVLTVGASTVYYTTLSRQLARLHEAYAEGARPPAWVPAAELARSATVATAVAVLTRRTGTSGLPAATRLALGLWAGFPAVLLTGSVVHEKVPWRLAAIHAGDWLVKLLLISVTVGRGPLRR